MASGASRRARHFSVDSIAGWVFADLLLVLFVVGLGSAIAYTPPEPPEPPPPPPKVAPIVGMKTDPVSIAVEVDAASTSAGAVTGAEARAVCKAVASQAAPVKGERAALVLVFGGGPDVVVGQNVARAVISQLGCASRATFGTRVPSRAFWDGTLPLGRARLEVFLFVTQKSSS